MTKKHKKPAKHKEERHRAIGNKGLMFLIAAVVLISATLAVASLTLSKPQQAWLKLQAKNLGYTLTGNKQAPEEGELPGVAEKLTIPILMYHHIGPLPDKADALRRGLTLSTDDFELEVAWLKGQGYESITLNDLLQYTKGKYKLPDKPVILTFDDGYEDVFENAVPTLKKYNFVGSFAVITQFPGIKQGTNQYASWQQIKQAQKEGMEIVSHTQDHFDGTDKKYDANFILRNLTDSKKDLQQNLGAGLPILVYPYGHYNERYLKLAKQAGFEMGLTTAFGTTIRTKELMTIPRVRINGGESLESFKKKILEGRLPAGSEGY